MYRYFLQNKQPIPVLKQRKDFVGPIKGTVMEQQYREVPESLLSNPSRLADPDLVQVGKPTFLRIGEGNEPRNELLRVIKQYPSRDEVRTKVLDEMFPPNETNPYFSRPDNIAAIRTASEQLGIPLERTGLRIATNPFRLEGNVADVNLLADITKQAAINLQKQGSPVLANALTRKAQFFNQPRSYRELAVDGSEGIDSIYDAYKKAEPDVNASSQGLRPIFNQAGGLDANIGIPSGSPENIPPMDIEGLRGAYAYKPADELKRPRFIDLGTGIYTRSGEPINADQKNLLDMGMADLEDRSFILKDPIDLARQPARALASRLPTNYYGAERDIPTGVDAVIRGWGRRNSKTGLLEGNINAQGYLQTDLPANYYGIPRDIPTELRAEYGRTGRRGLTPTRDELPLTREIGSIIGSQLNREQYRPTTRLGLQTLGLNADIGRETITPSVEIGDTLYPSNSTIVRRSIPINRLTDDLSNRVLSGEVDLRNYEPFSSNRNTYGATQEKTPWREYYSDPFVYEDKGQDNEVNRLVRAVNEAPAQLENAYTQQANANRRASDIQDTINVVRRMGRGTPTPQGDVFSLGVNPELVVKPTSLFNSLKRDRRIAEIDASKAQDRIAELKAAQELLGIEYMAKPKMFSPEVMEGYRVASRDKSGIKDSGYSERIAVAPVQTKPSRLSQSIAKWKDLEKRRQMEDEFNNRRDYDIASAFGFTGNY